MSYKEIQLGLVATRHKEQPCFYYSGYAVIELLYGGVYGAPTQPLAELDHEHV
ncbi:hypothetical protein BDR05DRAFT_968961 [Suillus weaverae]|nr:hypothetical protein BDR05DRAFT_968961 [Suillus weaverae]